MTQRHFNINPSKASNPYVKDARLASRSAMEKLASIPGETPEQAAARLRKLAKEALEYAEEIMRDSIPPHSA